MSNSALDVANVPKRRKTPKALRKEQILALQVQGLTQDDIAAKLGVSRRSITRDLEEMRPSQAAVADLLNEITTEYANLQKPEDIAWNYVDLAENAKNDAVKLAAQDRILEHRGVVTERERLRSKGVEHSAPAPMFSFVGPVTIDFGGNAKKSDVSVRDITPDVKLESEK